MSKKKRGKQTRKRKVWRSARKLAPVSVIEHRARKLKSNIRAATIYRKILG